MCQQLEDTYEDASNVGEDLQPYLAEHPQAAVLVRWSGGGIEAWCPGVIDSLKGNDMVVKYDKTPTEKVQKVDKIDVGTLAHQKLVVGSNNPSTRRVTAWILKEYEENGVLEKDGSIPVPVVQFEDAASESEASMSTESSCTDSEEELEVIFAAAAAVKPAEPAIAAAQQLLSLLLLLRSLL